MGSFRQDNAYVEGTVFAEKLSYAFNILKAGCNVFNPHESALCRKAFSVAQIAEDPLFSKVSEMMVRVRSGIRL